MGRSRHEARGFGLAGLAAALALTLAACGTGVGSAPEIAEPSDRTAAAPAAADGRIWFEVLGVTQSAPDSPAIALAEDATAYPSMWADWGLDGSPPAVDFDRHVVLFVARTDDACPDDLVAVTRTGDALTPTWLPPAGGCDQPAIPTGYAVALHRASLGPAFAFGLTGLHPDNHLERTFDLPPYAGPPAPEPPDVPMQPTDDEIDAIFAGHAVRPCDEIDDPMFREPQIDGPLSDDPEVAAAQRGRAGMGFPSDIATTTRLLEDPESDRAFGFPLSQDEFDSVWERQGQLDGEEMLKFGDRFPESFGYVYVDQSAGGVFTFGFTRDLEAREADLREAFPDVPTAVELAPFTMQELQAAHDPLVELLRTGQSGAWSLAVGLVRVELGVVDPTRETLDAIAEVTDPDKVCVRADFGGVAELGPG